MYLMSNVHRFQISLQSRPSVAQMIAKFKLAINRLKLPSWLKRLIPIALVTVVVSFAAQSLSEITWLEFQLGLTTVPISSAAIAILFAAASYLLLAVVEQINLRTVGLKLSWARVITISFTANAVSNQLSLAGVSGAGIRFRFLKNEDINNERVLNLIALNSLSL